MLVATAITMAVGWLLKSPCLGSWADGRQYNLLCYSDIVALHGSDDRDRGLDEDRFPYVEAENEYPVLTGLVMWVAALPATSYAPFFNWTALLLLGAALATAWALHRMVGMRALFFALAPSLTVYGLVNWDLVAVALASGATLAFLRERDKASGALLGGGAAAKLYPALFVIPFALDRLRQDRRRDAARLAGIAAGVWALLNLPFALLGFDRWSLFFRFNGDRNADWDTLWFMAERHLGFTFDPGVLNVLTVVALAVTALVAWRAKEARHRRFSAWTFGFPLLILFLLTSKVYSPQFGLWLLPWFALALPDLRLFVAFELADVAVFVTRFQFFAQVEGIGPGLPFWMFEVAVLIRAAILIACVVAWVRRPAPEIDRPHPVAASEAA